jgi:hypothetical protein
VFQGRLLKKLPEQLQAARRLLSFSAAPTPSLSVSPPPDPGRPAPPPPFSGVRRRCGVVRDPPLVQQYCRFRSRFFAFAGVWLDADVWGALAALELQPGGGEPRPGRGAPAVGAGRGRQGLSKILCQ